MRVQDNYDQWLAHERQQEKQLEKFPICENAKCGKRIQDEHYFFIEGEILCEECMISCYRKNTEDYCGGCYE